MKDMAWQGVILEESLEDKSLLKLAKILSTSVDKLGGEDRIMTFHNIEVEDKNKDKFIEKAIKTIKQSFYLHICKEGVMYVIFRGRMFKFSKGYPEIKCAKEHGKSIGIIEQQMPFEHLIDHPFG